MYTDYEYKPGEAELSAGAVHQDHPDREGKLDGGSRVELSGSEASGIKEWTVYFDIRFHARIPSEDPEEKPVQVIVNLEVQGDDRPGYPLVTRGYYYCAGMNSPAPLSALCISKSYFLPSMSPAYTSGSRDLPPARRFMPRRRANGKKDLYWTWRWCCQGAVPAAQIMEMKISRRVRIF